MQRIRMSYLLLGHASEKVEKRNRVPDGCMLVLAEKCGVQGTFPHALYPIFADKANERLFANPSKYKVELEQLFKKSLTIYVAGEEYPMLSYNFVNASVSTDVRKHDFMEPSGVYAIPGDLNQWIHHPERTGFARYASPVPAGTDIRAFYRGAIYPELPTSDRVVYGEVAFRATQEQLFRRLPGIYFSMLCRSVDEVDEEILAILRREFPRDAILDADPYNRPALLADWLRRRRRLTATQRAGLRRINELVQSVLEQRRLSDRTDTTSIDSLVTLLQAKRVSSAVWQQILDWPASDLDETDSHDGRTLLSTAAEHGHLRLVQNLMGRGASLDLADYDGVTPLMFACLEGHVAVAACLIKGGSLVTAADDDGTTALHICAANSAMMPVVRRLLDAGADPSLADAEGDTPVHVAAAHDMIGILRLLIRKGGSVHVANARGNTPLLEALSAKNEVSASFLVGISSLSVQSRSGKTCLGLALAGSMEDLATKMIRLGCPVSNWSRLLLYAKQKSMLRLQAFVQQIVDGEGFDALTKKPVQMIRCLTQKKTWLGTRCRRTRRKQR